MFGQVDSVGVDLVDDMRMAVQGTSAKTLVSTCDVLYNNSESNDEKASCKNDGASKFVSVVKRETVEIKDSSGNTVASINNVPIYGAFCTGTYSYIWNSGYYWIDSAEFPSKSGSDFRAWRWLTLKYKNESNGDATVVYDEWNNKRPFKLIKIKDNERGVCIKAYENTNTNSIFNKYSSGNVFPGTNVKNVNGDQRMEIDITSGVGDGKLDEDPVYLIASGGSDNMAIYSLDVQKPAVSDESNSVFYSASFLLGTIDEDVRVTDDGGACVPSSGDTVSDYCAVGRFSFAIRTGGE